MHHKTLHSILTTLQSLQGSAISPAEASGWQPLQDKPSEQQQISPAEALWMPLEHESQGRWRWVDWARYIFLRSAGRLSLCCQAGRQQPTSCIAGSFQANATALVLDCASVQRFV